MILRRKVIYNVHIHYCPISVYFGGHQSATPASTATTAAAESTYQNPVYGLLKPHDFQVNLIKLLLFMMTSTHVPHLPKSPIIHSPSLSSSSSSKHFHLHPTHYPQISHFRASQHILARHKSNSQSSNQSVSSNTNQQHPTQVSDPDEEAINILTFSGIFYKLLIFVISFLPSFLIERLLTLFAWVQLELLKAKGRNINQEQTYSKLKKKRKLKKKKVRSLNNQLSPNTTPPTSLPPTTDNSENESTQHSKDEDSSSQQQQQQDQQLHQQDNHGVEGAPILSITPSSPTPISSGNDRIYPTSASDPELKYRGQNAKIAIQQNLNSHSVNGAQQMILDPEQMLRQQHIAKWEHSLHTTPMPSLSVSDSKLITGATDNHLSANQFRPRSDSISVLPTSENIPSRSISEIRRVNSEATLYQTSEDTLLFEANQQSRKEFEDFLRSVKDIKDVHNWLRNFSGSATRKIAIVKISRRILDTPYGIEQAASSLCFMYKFGLLPVVIHGGLNDIARDPYSQVVTERRARSVALKEAIKKNGVGSTVLTPDICEIEPMIEEAPASPSDDTLSEEELEFGRSGMLPNGGLNMKIDSFDYEVLTQALEKGKIPIWDSVAETTDGVEVPINSDVTTFELAKRLQPYKIIFACNDGGILDVDHKALPVVYLDQDYKHLMEAEHVTDRRRVQLKQMKRIVDNLPSTTSLVVTSIESITHQLLFPRLANGTIIKRREDNKVLIFDQSNFHTVDLERLRVLIEDSFGRVLSEDYFEYLRENLHKLYICISADDQYNGCAIVTFKKPDYIPYLCKFCVQKCAQGLGLGDLIWRMLQRDNDKLYWRSRNNNPLNPWYFQRCQGSFRADEHFTAGKLLFGKNKSIISFFDDKVVFHLNVNNVIVAIISDSEANAGLFLGAQDDIVRSLTALSNSIQTDIQDM
eukprot:gene12376-14519_t